MERVEFAYLVLEEVRASRTTRGGLQYAGHADESPIVPESSTEQWQSLVTTTMLLMSE